MANPAVQALGLGLGLVLTLMIYSYVLVGDNPLYRLTAHLLVGVGLAYAVVVTVYAVLIPQFVEPFRQLQSGAALGIEEMVQPAVALLAILLLLKLSPRTAPYGNVAMGFAMGVGAAVAVGGAVLGTLMPQVNAAALPLLPGSGNPLLPDHSDLVNVGASAVVILGTISSLLYFHFGAEPTGEGQVERPTWLRPIAWIGQIFLMVALGSLFAGALIASLSLLTERAQFIKSVPQEIMRLLGRG